MLHTIHKPNVLGTCNPSLAGDGRRRKALLIGCNYPGTSAALAGCCNDAVCMEYLLKHKARMRSSYVFAGLCLVHVAFRCKTRKFRMHGGHAQAQGAHLFLDMLFVSVASNE
jgi:Caspase domain